MAPLANNIGDRDRDIDRFYFIFRAAAALVIDFAERIIYESLALCRLRLHHRYNWVDSASCGSGIEEGVEPIMAGTCE